MLVKDLIKKIEKYKDYELEIEVETSADDGYGYIDYWTETLPIEEIEINNKNKSILLLNRS